MASVKGFVEKIKYRNEENGYTVLSLTGSDDGEEYILVGNFSFIGEGELLEASRPYDGTSRLRGTAVCGEL